MPRQLTRQQFLNFVGGLNTESSPLVFPENTAKAIDNVDLRRDGSIKRRRGLDYEALGVYSNDTFAESSLQDYALSAHEWKSVDGDDTLNFTVVQVGGVLYFHQLGASVLSTAIEGSIDLDPIKVRSDFEEFPISASVGKGKFFIVSKGISPAYIEYDPDSGVFSGIKLTIKIRDLDGIDEADDASPTVFGSSVTPSGGTDPVDDIYDVTDPSPTIDFSVYVEVGPGPSF